MSVRRWSPVVGYGLPGMILGLAVAAWFGGRSPSALAQAPAQSGEASGTIAFTSPIGGSAQMLYLIDTRSQAFAVYRVDPMNPKGNGAVKLEATRQYRWDLKLNEYNNQAPEVTDVEAMVRSIGANNGSNPNPKPIR